MGKKSRRPNRNKPKDTPAPASSAVASPRQMITSTTDDVATFMQLYTSRDWAGLLEIESKMIAVVKMFESSNPELAGCISWNLGTAHRELGREGGIEHATSYFKKAAELEGGNNVIRTAGMLGLAQCYVKMGRVEEAMDLYKSLCDEIGKETLHPVAILELAEILRVNHETSRSLTILEEHLDNIERSWEKPEQCRAYEFIAAHYRAKTDYAKSNVYFERQLPIAKETKNVDLEASALYGLGRNYVSMSDYDKAMAYLEQALVIARQGERIGMTYTAMGDVLVAQEGREKEGILMFQTCVGLLEEGNQSKALIEVILKLGRAYTQIEAWDDAIATLEKGFSIAESIGDERLGHQSKAAAKQSLGKTYLEKYASLPERNDELIRTALFWSQAAYTLRKSKGGVNHLDLHLDLAQEHYFLGDLEKAHAALKIYLGGKVRLGASCCQTCHQTCAKDAHMEKCSVCKVARYCSRDHSIQAWKKGRLCHRVMCPFLKRWRKITEGKGAAAELCDELFNDFFERVLASSKPK